MDDLIIRVLNGQATPPEEERLTRWRRDSDANEAYFVQTQRVWELTEPLGGAVYAPPPAAETITGARDDRGDAVSLTAHRARKASGRWRLGLGLSVAAAAAAVAIGVQVMNPAGPAVQPLATFAAADDVITVTLDDGTIARLAPGSHLEQWPAPGERRFSLRGKAFFAVRHDPERPFVVEAAGAEARVLGTRFELLERDGELRTVVVDGRVAVSNEAGRVEVPAGSVGDAVARVAPSVRSVEDVYGLLDWPGGLLVFQGTPLFRAAEEISRHFGRTVEVRGEELRELRVTAQFGEEGFEEVVQALCDVSGAGCRLTDSGALLTP